MSAARWQIKTKTPSLTQWNVIHGGMARTVKACGVEHVAGLTHDQLVAALLEHGDVDTRPERAAQGRERFLK